MCYHKCKSQIENDNLKDITKNNKKLSCNKENKGSNLQKTPKKTIKSVQCKHWTDFIVFFSVFC